MIWLLLLQAAAPAPDIELDVRLTAKSVEIERKGEVRLEVRAEPEASSQVQAQVKPANEGATKLRNVEVTIHAEASIADPSGVRIETEAEAETPTPD